MTRLMARRPRRLLPRPEQTEFLAPPLPMVSDPPPFSWVQLAVMAVASVSMIAYGVVARNWLTVGLGVLAIGASMAGPILMRNQARKQAAARDMLRRKTFDEILTATATQVEQAKTRIRADLEDRHPTPKQGLDWLAQGRCWERRRAEADFLEVAIGEADIASGLKMTLSTRQELERVPAEAPHQAATQLREQVVTLESAPLCVDWRANPVLAIDGPREAAVGLARALLTEVALCCGPDEVTMLMVIPKSETRTWQWARELPHIRKALPPGATQPLISDVKELTARLSKLLEPRERIAQAGRAPATQALEGPPHLLIVIDRFGPISELFVSEPLRKAFKNPNDLGISILTISDDEIDPTKSRTPETASLILALHDDHAGTTQWVGQPLQPLIFAPSSVDEKACVAIVDNLKDLALVNDLDWGTEGGKGEFLLDLIKHRPNLAAPLDWPDHDQRDLLKVTFGTGTDGNDVTLDLKESALGGHGPHGMLIGATGSGKSEFLRALVTSLAATHSPSELNMAFVDFKGGATFDELAKLPHCVGNLTNLADDPTLIERMKQSLIGELVHRQQQLAACGNDIQDIHAYRLLRATTQPQPPELAYLLVIIDEFGELLEAKPDFLDALLSIGRLGRSVGVHLLLSSQRLEAGRIRGLESYLSYRIALRTFNAEESMAAIRSKAAAELPPLPGHGYLLTPEHTTRFRAARVSVDGENPTSSSGTTDLKRVVTWAGAAGSKPPALWQTPLPNPARAELFTLEHPALLATPADPSTWTGGLPIPVGLIDDPTARTQEPFTFDPAQSGGHLAVVGAAQTGKSTVLADFSIQACALYPPKALTFHIIDMGANLTPLRQLPNVGAYTPGQDRERVSRVILEMTRQIAERANWFDTTATASMAHARTALATSTPTGDDADATGVPGHLMLLIDNYAAFRDRYPNLDEILGSVFVEGGPYGVHVGLASARWADILPRKLEQISQRLELRLNDPSDSRHARSANASLPRDTPGRGLARAGLMVQSATPEQDETRDAGRWQAAINRVTATHAQTWRSDHAQTLRLLRDLTPAEFDTVQQETTQAGQVLLGVSEIGLQPVALPPPGQHLLLYGDPHSGRTTTLQRLITTWRPGSHLHLIDLRGDLARRLPQPPGIQLATTPDEVATLVDNLAQSLQQAQTSPQTQTAQPLERVLIVDDFELVVDACPTNPLETLNSYASLAARLGFTIIINQVAADSYLRPNYPSGGILKRMQQGAAWCAFYSIADPTTSVAKNFKPRNQPPGVATLQRDNAPTARVLTLPPETTPAATPTSH